MAVNTNNSPQLLTINELSAIHLADPAIGRALQTIVDYINKNVTPVQGDKQPIRPTVPGGQPLG